MPNEIAEIAADGVADGMHIVSEEDLAVEKVVQSLGNIRIAYIGVGMALGAAAGAILGFKIAYSRAELKYNQIAEDEIAEMRQYYWDKSVALENTVGKPQLEDIVREQGYSTAPPMAVTPPEAVVEAAREAAEEEELNTHGKHQKVIEDIEEKSEPEVRNIFRDARVEDNWDYHKERTQRSPLRPYVIHRDERDDQQTYDGVTFTYYEADDVLCNERDEVIPVDERDKLIGEANLEKFGHGSGDASIVYIRNDQLEMDIEMVRSPNSYAEEVHGFDPSEIRHSYRRGRKSFDDE